MSARRVEAPVADLFGGAGANAAVFSECARYRYQLWRVWDGSLPYVLFVGLNPSTADELNDDPTIRRCIAFAKSWGYGGLCMGNLFAFRATLPAVMKAHPEPVGVENDAQLAAAAATAGLVVAAWGLDGEHLGRAKQVKQLLPTMHVLKLTKDGHPNHPLYLRKAQVPIPWHGVKP